VRAALVLVIGFSLAAVGTPHAGASSRGVLPGFFQVSAAEKRQTRPLADLVLARQGRKTVAWLVGVTGDPLYPTAGDLEIRCAQERGRWVLTDILQEGVRVGTLRT